MTELDKSVADQQGDFIAGVVTGALVGGILGGLIGFMLAPKLGKGSAEEPQGERERLNGTAAPPFPAERGRGGAAAGPSPSDWKDWERETERISQARRTLEAKIAELNEAIQATRAQLMVKEGSSISPQKRRD